MWGGGGGAASCCGGGASRGGGGVSFCGGGASRGGGGAPLFDEGCSPEDSFGCPLPFSDDSMYNDSSVLSLPVVLFRERERERERDQSEKGKRCFCLEMKSKKCVHTKVDCQIKRGEDRRLFVLVAGPNVIRCK